ncbi:12321_t:CDS:2 [Entrophospora sp. SA101]|nr:12321_t:CDS:2 [Entrophospora sp. SA101]
MSDFIEECEQLNPLNFVGIKKVRVWNQMKIRILYEVGLTEKAASKLHHNNEGFNGIFVYWIDVEKVKGMVDRDLVIDEELVKWMLRAHEILKSNSIHAISEPNSTNSQIVENTPTPNGFISAFLQAYNEHQHLKISPDDVWLTIAQGVSHHINFNSEKYHYMFVDHEGKKEICINVRGILSPTSSGIVGNWNKAVEILTDATDRQVKEEVELKQLLECNFTTTTPTTKTSSNIVLLDTVKAYFSYGMTLGCGIPKITLTGTLEDWMKIQEKLFRLRKLNLDLDFWLNKLDPIIWQFVSTYKGEIYEDFWSKAFTYKRYGSGGQKSLTGWIATFFPYNRAGHPLGGIVNLYDLPYGRVSVPFGFDDLKLQLITGFIGYKQEIVSNNDGNIEN